MLVTKARAWMARKYGGAFWLTLNKDLRIISAEDLDESRSWLESWRYISDSKLKRDTVGRCREIFFVLARRDNNKVAGP